MGLIDTKLKLQQPLGKWLVFTISLSFRLSKCTRQLSEFLNAQLYKQAIQADSPPRWAQSRILMLCGFISIIVAESGSQRDTMQICSILWRSQWERKRVPPTTFFLLFVDIFKQFISHDRHSCRSKAHTAWGVLYDRNKVCWVITCKSYQLKERNI